MKLQSSQGRITGPGARPGSNLVARYNFHRSSRLDEALNGGRATSLSRMGFFLCRADEKKNQTKMNQPNEPMNLTNKGRPFRHGVLDDSGRFWDKSVRSWCSSIRSARTADTELEGNPGPTQELCRRASMAFARELQPMSCAGRWAETLRERKTSRRILCAQTHRSRHLGKNIRMQSRLHTLISGAAAEDIGSGVHRGKICRQERPAFQSHPTWLLRGRRWGRMRDYLHETELADGRKTVWERGGVG